MDLESAVVRILIEHGHVDQVISFAKFVLTGSIPYLRVHDVWYGLIKNDQIWKDKSMDQIEDLMCKILSLVALNTVPCEFYYICARKLIEIGCIKFAEEMASFIADPSMKKHIREILKSTDQVVVST